jgi:hypothetical protein
MAGKEPFIVKLFTTFFSLRAVCALAFFQSAIVLLNLLLISTARAAGHFCFPFAFKTRALFTHRTPSLQAELRGRLERPAVPL